MAGRIQRWLGFYVVKRDEDLEPSLSVGVRGG